MSLKVVRR